MKNSPILVVGATGKTGFAVASQLREKEWPVRAMVHRRDARSQRLDHLGAETVVADLFDSDQLREALHGVSRAYYCPPVHPYMIQSAAAFAVAAREANLETLVGLSQWLASASHPSLATRQNWLVDHLFSMIPGVAHTLVNPGLFADNTLRLIDFAAHLGVLPNLVGDSRNAPPSNEDIARVAVAALIEPEKHAGKTYRPTGPKLLSADDMTQILSRVLGRRVRRFDMPLWMFLKTARLQGVSAFEMSGFRYYIEEQKRGTFELGAPNDHVLEVTGQQPEDFETSARRYAARPEARRNRSNALRTFAEFMRTPVSPGYNLDKFERQKQFPTPSSPRLARDDPNWMSQRGQLA
jgi:uncharacterized protein YbjT (DUF2867 family)